MEPREPGSRENLRKWKLSRRRFLQILGLAGAGTTVAAAIPRLASGTGSNGAEQTEPAPEAAPTADTGASEPRRTRKWMRIIDLRRCDGCQSQGTPPQCTEACSFAHFLPEPMEWIEVYEHEIDFEARDAAALGIWEQGKAMEGTRFVPTPCMHCQNPPCVNVCPVGATWSTPEGLVLIDHPRCIGCRLCMAACPYERRFYTWGKPPIPPEALFVEFSVEHQVPLRKGIVAKCSLCPELLRAGRLPFCVAACPQKALYLGDFEEDLATNGEEVVKVSQFLRDTGAVRMKEQLRTRPRVYYIPGHGQAAGRDPKKRDRLPVRWRYEETLEGAKHWKRPG